MTRFKDKVIAVDFDGTCVTHEYPEIGKDIGAQAVLKRLSKEGVKIILWTMRSGKYLDQAVEWFSKNNIPLYGINENPTQALWTQSPKAYANLYIDDTAIKCPLKFNPGISSRPYVDWGEIEKLLFGD